MEPCCGAQGRPFPLSWLTKHSLSRREGKGDTPLWQPTPVHLPGKAHGQRSLAGYSPWGHKEPDPPPPTHTHTRARAHVAYLGRLLSGASHTSPLLSPASLTRPAQLVWGVSLSPGARQGTGAQEGTQLGTLLWGHEGRRPQPLPRYSRGGSRRARGHSRALTTGPLFLGWTVDGAAASGALSRQDRLGAPGALLRAAREGVGSVPHPHRPVSAFPPFLRAFTSSCPQGTGSCQDCRPQTEKRVKTFHSCSTQGDS